MMDFIGSISELPFFSSLEPQELRALASTAVRLHYKEGEIVFWEREACAGVYLVETGWLKAVRFSLQGREQVIRFLRPGDLFNEVAFFSGNPNLVTVKSLEESQVWLLQRDLLQPIMARSSSVCRMMLSIVSDRAQHLLQLVEDLSFRSVESRLARTILEHAEEDVASRRRWATQAEMAAHFGTVPDVLNRELKSLAERGLIRVERRKITILDKAGLKNIAMLEED